MLFRKDQINNTLRFYATLSALQLLCFNKNPDDGGGWNSERNRTNLLQESENVFVDLFPEQSIFNQDNMNLRKILEESTFQSWQSHVARKSLVEDLIRFDRNDNDDDRKITLYPLDIQNDTQEEFNSSVSLSLSLRDRRPFSVFQLPNDTRNLDSLTEYGLDERKPSSFNDFPTQDVFLDNSFYDLHLNTISNASSNNLSSSSSSASSSSLPSPSSSSSSSSHRKSSKNPLKKDAILPNINRIRRQDIDFFNRYNRDSNDTAAEASTSAAMREQETLTMMTNSMYKQDVDLGYTFSNYNTSYSMSSFNNQNEEAEKVKVIQNLSDTKLNDQHIDVGYLLALSSANALLNEEVSLGNNSSSASNNITSHQKLLNIQEDRRLAEILYEQDIDLGYILASAASPKESSSSKSSDKPVEKVSDIEDSNDVSDLWAGIPFKIDNETGEYIRLPFEDIFKDVIPMDENDLKDETDKPEELSSPIDIEATIQDIANLLEPGSEYFGMHNAEAAPYAHAHGSSYPPKDDANLCYESQQNQTYNYNNSYNYPTNLESTGAHSSNTLFAADIGTHDNHHNSSGVHDDAYLDSILKMMDIKNNETSSTQNHGNAMGASSSGSAKKYDNPQNTSSSPDENNGAAFLDLSCGSAGSSLGSLSSESLPSTSSDGEWGDGSDSGHGYGRSNFYGPYDYSSNNGNFTAGHVPVAQKKYHMFGKRYLQEEIPDNAKVHSRIHTLHSPIPVSKFEGKENSTSYDDFEEKRLAHSNIKNTSKVIKQNVKAERDKYKNTDQHLVGHNHTYATMHSPVHNPEFERDGSEYGEGGSESGHLSRDEKRALNLNVPIPVHDIINLPMDEFNERVSKYDLNENQLSLIRDIRRRGKNKVAAQNCRKRKLDTILTLESEVEEVRRRKEKLHNEKAYVAMEKKRIATKFAALHKHIFQYLKDDEGRPCSPSKFSLKEAVDGSLYLLPRETSTRDPNYFMSILMGEASSRGACRDRRRMNGGTNLDEKKSITPL